MEDDAIDLLMCELLPQARLVTPNIPEAEKLAGLNVHDEEDMGEAAARIRELGARAVLVKGGHLRRLRSEIRDQKSEQGSSVTVGEAVSEAIDLLDDEGDVTIFRGEWIDAPPVRGTGCMLSSAIAASLAKGSSLTESISAAKKFVAAEIQS
jgi:hydroxymethylpyrimidine/phosphomethylpyrimidine kinase